jgi:hypothetical protein
MRSLHTILIGVHEAKRPLQRLRHKWENNIKRDLKGISVKMLTDSAGSGCGPVAGFCELGNESLGFINSMEFFDQLCDNQLLKDWCMLLVLLLLLLLVMILLMLTDKETMKG